MTRYVTSMRESDEYIDTGPDSSHFQEFKLSYEPDFREILKAVLNVSKAEARTYFALLQQGNADVRSLADEIECSESTVREQLAALRETELVTRDIRVPESGQYHTYQAVPEAEAKSLLHQVVDSWMGLVAHRIDILTESPTDDSLMKRSAAAPDSESGGPQQVLDDNLPSRRSIATCIFGFTYPELKLYLVLLDNPRSTAQELAEVQDLSRTTVVGRLNTLQDRGFARPAPRTTEIGNSIAYEYVPRPLNEVKGAMTEQLKEEWIEYAHSCIEDFDLSSVDYRD
jgi:predicted transcriptional regulator